MSENNFTNTVVVPASHTWRLKLSLRAESCSDLVFALKGLILLMLSKVEKPDP